MERSRNNIETNLFYEKNRLVNDTLGVQIKQLS